MRDHVVLPYAIHLPQKIMEIQNHRSIASMTSVPVYQESQIRCTRKKQHQPTEKGENKWFILLEHQSILPKVASTVHRGVDENRDQECHLYSHIHFRASLLSAGIELALER